MVELKVGKTRGPVTGVVIEPEYLDATVPAGRSYVHPTTKGHTVFAYAGRRGQTVNSKYD